MSSSSAQEPRPPTAARSPVTPGAALFVVGLALLAATFFLLSPPPGETYPGAIPWRPVSLLRELTALLALHGWAASARGVEIKELALHLAAAAGLALAGWQAWCGGGGPRTRAAVLASIAQLCFSGWVLISWASAAWSDQPDLARGQALLYALALAWAVAVAAVLPGPLVHPLLVGYAAVASAGAALGLWYFFERNPHHRLGFPIGNPTALAAALLPAILYCATEVLIALRSARQRIIPLAVAGTALVPLLGALYLTRGRGALIAGAVGVAVMAVLRVGPRRRWLVAALLAAAIIAGAAALYSVSRLDVTMARGAAARFRVYAWQYAAQLWQSRPLAGHGAGAYPRLAGGLAARDQVLDPGAFMAELVEHAHNELFEILAEIGLVGGVTFVAGIVATFAAAAALVQRTADPAARARRLALTGGVAALLADGLMGVTQRLPGGPAVLYTLLGALWAACRAPAAGPSFPAVSPSAARLGRATGAAVCAVAAVAAGWVAVRNWGGVQHELAAQQAFAREDYAEALAAIRAAESDLLDPVSKLQARDLALRCQHALAWTAVAPLVTDAPSTTPTARAEAFRRSLALYEAADGLRRAVPALQRTDAYAARAAEWLAALSAADDPHAARHWTARAEQAWRRQRQRTPYDTETLLALTRYPGTLADHLALLRDALRVGRPTGLWLATLEQLARVPGFDATVAEFLAAAGPVTPQTDLDALVASMAPEMFRLAAATRALRGAFAEAVALVRRAVELYAPLRPRFPELYSTALAEQARYTLHDDAEAGAVAVALLEDAIAALPRIQTQKYDELARPYRMGLALAQLAAGDPDGAAATVRTALGAEAEKPGAVAGVLAGLLRDARAMGLSPAALDKSAAALRHIVPNFHIVPGDTEP